MKITGEEQEFLVELRGMMADLSRTLAVFAENCDGTVKVIDSMIEMADEQ